MEVDPNTYKGYWNPIPLHPYAVERYKKICPETLEAIPYYVTQPLWPVQNTQDRIPRPIQLWPKRHGRKTYR